MTDDQLLTRPIVVLGAPRSGTTLLAQVLSRHPQLCLIEEPRITWKYGNDRRSDMLSPGHASPAVVRHIRGQFARQVRDAGATRLLEKTPSNSLRVGFVNRVLPDCLFVHVLRSGEQSVLSIRSFWQAHSTGVPLGKLQERVREIRLRQTPHYAYELLRRVAGKLRPGVAGPAVWGPRLPGIDAMARDLDPLEVCALQWRLCVETACREGRKLPPERYTELRLEELDEAVLSRLMDYCGLPASEEVLNEYRQRFDKSAPSGRSKRASAEDAARAEELVAPTAAWLATLPPVERHMTTERLAQPPA